MHDDGVQPGTIVVLNGEPRSGKSSIAAAIQESFEGVWLNLGVDAAVGWLAPALKPGIGLRPGGERPDFEPMVARLFAALYESVAVHSRFGLNVVVDVGHHDDYSQPRGMLRACARRLDGLPALLVGVRCPIDVIMARRAASPPGQYLTGTADDPYPEPVRRWAAVHNPGIYDLELDTSALTPAECAAAIGSRLRSGQPFEAWRRLAGLRG